MVLIIKTTALSKWLIVGIYTSTEWQVSEYHEQFQNTALLIYECAQQITNRTADCGSDGLELSVGIHEEYLVLLSKFKVGVIVLGMQEEVILQELRNTGIVT